MGHLINSPKRPNFPNVFVQDIEIEKHFFPSSFFKYLPCNTNMNLPFKIVLGVFAAEEIHDNTELLIDYKDLFILSNKQ